MKIEIDTVEYQELYTKIYELNKKYNELKEKNDKIDKELTELYKQKEELKHKLIKINEEVRAKLNAAKTDKNIEDIALFTGALIVGGIGVYIGGQYGEVQGIIGFITGATTSTLAVGSAFTIIDKKREKKEQHNEEYKDLIDERAKTYIAIEKITKKINKLKEEWNNNIITEENIEKEIIEIKQEISNLFENNMKENTNQNELSMNNTPVKRRVLSIDNKGDDN